MPEASAPPVRKRSDLAASAVLTVSNVVAMALMIVVFCFVTPRFVRIYGEMGTALPRLTQAVLSVPYTGAAAVLGLLAAGLVAGEFLIANKRVMLWVNVGMGLAFAPALATYLLAMVLPLMGMLRAVQGR